MIVRLTLAAGLALALLAGAASAEAIKVGVTPGPHAQILEKVKEIAARDGLDIEILEFSDYVVPNQALNDGELNANSFQHQPYLDNQIADRGFDLVDVAYTVNFPLGIYSKKHKSFDELPEGATVGIPNDPTNGGRALLVIADHGYIKLNAEKGLRVTVADITENPKKLNFIELGAKAPYINLIAVRSADRDAPWVKQLVDTYHTDEVKQFVVDTFKGAVVPAW